MCNHLPRSNHGGDVGISRKGSDFDMTYNSDRYRNFHVRELDRGGGSQLIRISFPEFW